MLQASELWLNFSMCAEAKHKQVGAFMTLSSDYLI